MNLQQTEYPEQYPIGEDSIDSNTAPHGQCVTPPVPKIVQEGVHVRAVSMCKQGTCSGQ